MKRILLKISGEAFSSETMSIDPIKVEKIADMLADLHLSGMSLVIVF